ncbi:hypothetical protein OZX72_07945 [Bifidobacterium sp. ESL0769]|uniref:hypothetical protein n=1 Tax=Bifidobacterium sp. ESL0769 TaxID=2983229 RepID=UPI0023F93C5F|nr:hypothetical protein [Bifidobacterium sp. ESL0769]WEV67159.1 hypothetical protein OZX72_07945 [Bifidobacterium sp. ESL0769]
MSQTLPSNQQPGPHDLLLDIDDDVLAKFTNIAHTDGRTTEDEARSLIEDYASGKLVRVNKQS